MRPQNRQLDNALLAGMLHTSNDSTLTKYSYLKTPKRVSLFAYCPLSAHCIMAIIDYYLLTEENVQAIHHTLQEIIIFRKV